MHSTSRLVTVGFLCWMGGAGVGHLFSISSTPAPPPEIKTETKTVTKTQTVVQHLPKSCYAPLADLRLIEDQLDIISSVTGKHLDTMTAAGIAIFKRDIKKLNAATQAELRYKDVTDLAIIKVAELKRQYKLDLQQCSTDIRYSS